MRQVDRILYIRTDRMGDVLMNLPALHQLRQNFPKAWLTLLADRSVAAFFKGIPDLDEVMEVDPDELKRGGARRSLKKAVRAARFDMAVISNPGKSSHWLAFACGIPARLGWRRKWPFLLTRSLPDTKDCGARHEIDANLALVSLVCGKKWDGTLDLGRDEKAALEIKKILDEAVGEGSVIAIHAGSSNPLKKWPLENFERLCRTIRDQKKYQLVFIGAEEEFAHAQTILRYLGGGGMNLCGKTSWRQLASFFADERVKTMVSSDSGPVHVAWMSGKPVVALYAKDCPGSGPARWGPRNDGSEIIYKPMREISPEEVLEKLKKVLGP